MLYQVGDSRHTQNIQINKVIVENEECVFLAIPIIYEVIPPINLVPTWYHTVITILSTMLHSKYS